MNLKERKDQHKEKMKQLMMSRVGFADAEVFDKVYQYAWDYGHANGYHEVEFYFEELLEIVQITKNST